MGAMGGRAADFTVPVLAGVRESFVLSARNVFTPGLNEAEDPLARVELVLQAVHE